MDLWSIKRPSSLLLSEPGQRRQRFLYLLGVSPSKAPGTLRGSAGLSCRPSLGGCGRQPVIVFFPFTHNRGFHLGLPLVNPILPLSSGWPPWPSATSTGKQGALLSGRSNFSFPTAALSVDKDFWPVFKDVAAELSTSVLSSICFYDISSILHCSL